MLWCKKLKIDTNVKYSNRGKMHLDLKGIQ